MSYILALDEGTTSARAAIYDGQARRLAMESAPVPCRYPRPGWVEQDGEDIWLAQLETARRVLEKARIPASTIQAIGITNQRETAIVWDAATGRAIAPAIVWQCRRTADYCRRLAASDSATAVTTATGLVIDAYFSASKIAWILENVPDARRRAADGELRFGTVDSWLVWKLTGGRTHVTDVSNASRTMLMDLESGQWSLALLGSFDIPPSMLPRIVPSSEVVGVTQPALFGVEIPIAGIAGDQQAALAGQACFRPGLSKNTYGTGCFALLHTGAARAHSQNRLLATRAASPPGVAARFAIEGSIFIAGAAIDWLRDRLGILASAVASEALAASVTGTSGVYMVPAFVGLGAPYWDPQARASLTGMTLATGQAEIVRAALESIAYQTRDLVEAMESDSGRALTELRVDGGAAANNFLMQFQADILGKPIVRPVDVETTALGAAFLAGLASGFWESPVQLESFWRAERTFEPSMDDGKREQLYAGWKQAVANCRGLPLPS